MLGKLTARLRPPDLVQERAGRHLLMWGDVPHWMVVDGEYRRFLEGCDGRRSVGEVLRAQGQALDRKLGREIRSLLRRGILRAGPGSDPSELPERPPRLENIAINLTGRCNLHCRMCYFGGEERPATGPELSGEEIGRWLRASRPCRAGKCSLMLLGGEPLLEMEKLRQVVATARRQRLKTIISTNGLLITAEWAGWARQAGLEVQVSLDGATAATHEQLRGTNSFDRTIQGIKVLVEHGVATILSLVCYKENFRELEAFYNLAEGLGVAEARFIPLKRLGAARNNQLEPVPVADMITRAAELFRQHPRYRRLAGRDCLSILGQTCRYGAVRDSCGSGRQTVLLDADGSLYPCLNTRQAEFRLGNIRERDFDFQKRWREGAGLVRYREATALRALAACRGCTFRYWCLGSCRGEAWATCGRLDGPAPNCPDLRRAIIETIWIMSEQADWFEPGGRNC